MNVAASARQIHDGGYDQQSRDGFGLLGLGMIRKGNLDLVAGDVCYFGFFFLPETRWFWC
jgi:hypothetical protein